MNSMTLAFSVVFPLFITLALGYFLRAIKLFDNEFLKQLNNLCFKIFLPITLFMNIYKSNFNGNFQRHLIFFAVSSIVIFFVFLLFFVPLVIKDNNSRGVMIQGMFRANYILFGFPITISLFGSENVSPTAILMVFVIPVFNILSVIALEIFSSKKSNISPVITIAKGIVTNPLIIASLMSFLFVSLNIKFPKTIEIALIDISKISTPLALIALGGGFEFSNLSKNSKLLLIAVCGKLVIMPLIFLTIAIRLGFKGVELGALLSMLASPTAISSYPMAHSMGSNHELAGQIVVLTSSFAILSIFVWISVLKHLCLI